MTDLVYIAVVNKNTDNSYKLVKEQYDHVLNIEKVSDFENCISERVKNFKTVIISQNLNTIKLTTNIYSKLQDIVSVIISNNPVICENKNVQYIGIDKTIMNDESLYELDNNLATYYTFDKIKQIGLNKLCQILCKNNLDKKIHLVIDLQIIDKTIAPSVKRNESQKNYFSLDCINSIITEFKKQLWSLEIIGFSDTLNDITQRHSKLTAELCKSIICKSFDITEKSMNIFTEDSRFLIYRPVEQKKEDDIGWYIVKFLTLKEREQYLKYLIDNVITITIDSENGDELDIYVTSTSTKEQNERSYYASNDIYDYCLFPDEKVSMVFELLNTSQNSVIV